MSDATLPTLCSTSSEADLRSTYSSVPNSSEGDVYPFLVHSQHSIINGEPPEVDNGKLARQKRKRTSPEDQAALETEYKRNPKPDKAARMEIMKKVSLAEKEVQIWFQNRRQNTRRKTRPLLPHEIASFGLGGMATLSPAPVIGNAHGVSGGTELPLSTYALETSSGSQERSESSDDSQEIQREYASSVSHEPQEQTNENPDLFTPSAKPINTPTDPHSRTFVQSSAPHNVSRSLFSASKLPATLGYLSNRRNARASSLGIPTSSAIPIVTAGFNPKHSPPSSCPERISAGEVSPPSASQVRLSLSLDGKAELVSSSVSPPRQQRTRALSPTSTINQTRPGLKRCQSDVPSSHVPCKSASKVPLNPQITSGRSRDARTWEFCCDTDARDELTTQAENESSGSAVAAISLLRSTSTSNLKANGSKRNAQAPRKETVVHGKKPKLARASSSLARLHCSDKALLKSPSGDSDKENWLPQGGSGSSQRRDLALTRPQKQKRRRLLEESKIVSTHVSILGGHKTTHGKPAPTEGDIFEGPMSEPKVDREVDKFMRGEVSPGKKGDLDCIQGLLSLSQGTWR